MSRRAMLVHCILLCNKYYSINLSTKHYIEIHKRIIPEFQINPCNHLIDEIEYSGWGYPLSCVDPTVNKNRGAGHTVSSKHLNTKNI